MCKPPAMEQVVALQAGWTPWSLQQERMTKRAPYTLQPKAEDRWNGSFNPPVKTDNGWRSSPEPPVGVDETLRGMGPAECWNCSCEPPAGADAGQKVRRPLAETKPGLPDSVGS